MTNKIVIVLALLLGVFFFIPSIYFMMTPELTAIEFLKGYWWCYLICSILVILLQSMRKPSYIVYGNKGHGRTYGKKHFDEQRKRKEMEEALKYCQNKLYTLVNTPNGVKDNLKIDAQKAFDRCNKVLGEIKN